jgi:hypothetical protein
MLTRRASAHPALSSARCWNGSGRRCRGRARPRLRAGPRDLAGRAGRTAARTGNPLDLAIAAPEGFFAVETPRGERFTRAGRFTLDGEGRITDPDGNPVLGTGGQPIRVGAGDTRIDVKATARCAARTARSASFASCASRMSSG